jgi:hypothetical protein
MCTGFLEVLSLVGTAMSAIGQLNQGQQQQDYHEYQAEQSRADAQAAREEGEVRADRIRRMGDAQQSEARAALAASGVEVGAGTPVRITQQIERDAEWDARQEMLSGERRGARLDADAEGNRIAGRNAVGSSYLAAGSTVASGWLRSRNSNGNATTIS